MYPLDHSGSFNMYPHTELWYPNSHNDVFMTATKPQYRCLGSQSMASLPSRSMPYTTYHKTNHWWYILPTTNRLNTTDLPWTHHQLPCPTPWAAQVFSSCCYKKAVASNSKWGKSPGAGLKQRSKESYLNFTLYPWENQGSLWSAEGFHNLV